MSALQVIIIIIIIIIITQHQITIEKQQENIKNQMSFNNNCL